MGIEERIDELERRVNAFCRDEPVKSCEHNNGIYWEKDKTKMNNRFLYKEDYPTCPFCKTEKKECEHKSTYEASGEQHCDECGVRLDVKKMKHSEFCSSQSGDVKDCHICTPKKDELEDVLKVAFVNSNRVLFPEDQAKAVRQWIKDNLPKKQHKYPSSNTVGYNKAIDEVKRKLGL